MSDQFPNQWRGSQYQDISLTERSRDIRLLTLCSGSWSDGIRCLTHVVSLDLDPVYEAVSYAWGEPKDTKEILLNGYIISVGSNLESLLRHLRQPSQALSLWVDALCINQQNISEKTHQVSMMGSIYRKCSRVYIWLGTPETKTDSLLDDMSPPNVVPSPEPLSLWDSPFGLAQHFAEDKHFHELPCYKASSSGPHLFEEVVFKGLWLLFSSAMQASWWTRLWCVQEALLPNEAIIVFGHWSISWGMLSTSAVNHHRHQLDCCADVVSQIPLRFTLYIDHLVMDRRPTINNSEDASALSPFNLDLMLRRYKHKHCQDPRDKVYGLLGLIDEQKHSKLLPDYSLTVNDVFTNAMKAIILELDGDLRCLTGSGFNSQRLGLPSWVRDLTLELDQNTVVQEGQRLEAYPLYNAAGNIRPHIQLQSKAKLGLRGVSADIVQAVGEPVQTRDTNHINQILSDWHHIAKINYSQTISFSANRNQENFWRAVIGDAYVDSENKWQRLSIQEIDMYEQWVSEINTTRRFETNLSLNEVFTLAMWAAISGRAMFITERGRLGLCEARAQAGDEVWVLDGGRIPFLLRPLNQISEGSGSHAFVGDCHVTGLMDGEAYQDSDAVAREVVIE